MKKFACAIVAMLAAALFLPTATVSATSLLERAIVHDKAGDVRGVYPGKAGVDVVDDDSRAFSRKQQGVFASEALPGTSDNRYSTLKGSHGPHPSL